MDRKSDFLQNCKKTISHVITDWNQSMSETSIHTNHSVLINVTDFEWLNDGPVHLSRQAWFNYLGISVHCIVCLISIIIGYVSIFKHYYKSKSMLKQLKYISISCIIVWTVSNISWLIAYLLYRRHHETISFAQYAASHIASAMAIHSSALGYFLFVISFAMRVYYSFKDSVFEMSQQLQRLIVIAAILGIVILVVSFGLKILSLSMPRIEAINTIFGLGSLQVWLVSTVVLALGMILYLVMSLILLKTMVKKMRGFAQFVSRNESNAISTRKISTTRSSAHSQFQIPTVDIVIASETAQESTDHEDNQDNQDNNNGDDSKFVHFDVSTPNSNLNSNEDELTIVSSKDQRYCDNLTINENDRYGSNIENVSSGNSLNCNKHNYKDQSEPDQTVIFETVANVVAKRDNHMCVSTTASPVQDCKVVEQKKQHQNNDDNYKQPSLGRSRLHTHSFPRNGSNTNVDSNDSKENRIKMQMMELVERLTVLYSVGLISSVVILLIMVFAIIILVQYGHYQTNPFYIVFYSYFRLLVMIDAIINCICLLLQHQTARPLYDKYCCCKSCVTRLN